MPMNYLTVSREAAFDEPIELVIGTPPELWLGVPGESEEERLARLDAAHHILADEPELVELVVRITVAAIEAETPDLLVNRPLSVAFAGHSTRNSTDQSDPTEGLA